LSNRYLRKQGNRESKGSKADSKRVLVSYYYLDRSQGQTLEQWSKTEGRLLRWENIIQRLNNCNVQQAITQKIIIRYDKLEADIHNMPKKSKWKYPQTIISKDIIWCKIVVMQLVRVIGFMEDNIFYVVFLDEKHEFYPTEPNNT
jgi:hypothetical protein